MIWVASCVEPSIMTVKVGVIFTGVVRLGWSFSASWACDWEKGIDGADLLLKGSSGSKLNAVM
jgi:hypothetical protein